MKNKRIITTVISALLSVLAMAVLLLNRKRREKE